MLRVVSEMVKRGGRVMKERLEMAMGLRMSSSRRPHRTFWKHWVMVMSTATQIGMTKRWPAAITGQGRIGHVGLGNGR